MLIRPYFIISAKRFAWMKNAWARITQDVKECLEEEKQRKRLRDDTGNKEEESRRKKLLEKVVEVEREKKSIQQEIAHKIEDARRRNVDDCLNKAAEIIRLQRKIEGLERDIEEHAALERLDEGAAGECAIESRERS
jgi:hypothetical protein